MCRGCRRYTLERSCASCGGETIVPRPPKFSLEDKYVRYRAEMKIEERRKLRLVSEDIRSNL